MADARKSGTIALYNDPHWNSEKHVLSIQDYAKGERHTIPPQFNDKATWVAWNLPVGTVVTVANHHKPRDSGKSVGNLDGMGSSVDLVGTGQIQGTDLRDCEMNDKIATWFWREVDLKLGAIELFEHPNFSGPRVTLFLSEWEAGKFHNLPDWHINDIMSSVRWKGLLDRQRVMMWEHPNGVGNSYPNIKGWGNIKEVANMSDAHFNDCVSCFKWEPILPVKEIIQPIKITPTGGRTQKVGDALVYNNTTETEQSISFEVKRTLSQTLTVSTSETNVRGVTSGLRVSAGIEEIGLDLEYSLELSYEYTKEKRPEASNTDSIEVTINHPVKAPPGGITEAKLEVSLSKIPQTFYTTTATRWYDQELSGSVRDNSAQGGGKYKREEQIVVQVAGYLPSQACTFARMFLPLASSGLVPQVWMLSRRVTS